MIINRKNKININTIVNSNILYENLLNISSTPKLLCN